MTDAEIKKALECEALPSELNCIHGEYMEAVGIYCHKKKQQAENCHDCEGHRMAYYGKRAKATLDLINRQKAEIDDLKRDTIPKLQSSLERANRYGLQVDEENKMLKAEIARLQENIAPPYLLINCDDKSAEELRETLKTQKPVVDNLVEEMVGEE